MKKEKAILVDLHKTLMNEDGTANKKLIDFVDYSSDDCKILIFTSANMTVEQIKEDLKKIGIKYDRCYSVVVTNNNENNDEYKKKYIYETYIKSHYDIELLIDNNKKCCKLFNKLGIDSLRYKKGD